MKLYKYDYYHFRDDGNNRINQSIGISFDAVRTWKHFSWVCLISVVALPVVKLKSKCICVFKSLIKDFQICIVCLFAKHPALRCKTKIGWLEVRIMCTSEATGLPAHCCFIELVLTLILPYQKIICSRHYVAVKFLAWH